MKKIPTKIKIENADWKVIRKWRIVIDGKECDGYCEASKKEIWLLHGLEKDHEKQIFTHEYIHAILVEKGFYLTALSSDVEELLVHGISKEIYKKIKF